MYFRLSIPTRGWADFRSEGLPEPLQRAHSPSRLNGVAGNLQCGVPAGHVIMNANKNKNLVQSFIANRCKNRANGSVAGRAHGDGFNGISAKQPGLRKILLRSRSGYVSCLMTTYLQTKKQIKTGRKGGCFL